MKTRTQSSFKQRGFSLLTGFILAIVMFGSLAFFLAGQGVNASFGSSYSNTSRVSSVLASAGYIKLGFDSVLLNSIGPNLVSFDTASNGIFNPSTGGAVTQALDPLIFSDSSASTNFWIYRGNLLVLEDVGGTANGIGDYTVVVGGLKQAVCQQINNILHGEAITSVFSATQVLSLPLATVIGNTPTGGPNYAKDTTTAANLTAAATNGIDGKLSGCYQTNDIKYVYIHTLLVQ